MSSPRKKSIQYGAHTLTMISVAWGLFSLLALFDWFDARRTFRNPNTDPDLTIWGIQLMLISITFHLFRTERKREVLWLGDDDEILEPVPQPFDLPQERKRLARELLAGLKALPRILLFFIAIGLLQNMIGAPFPAQVPDPRFMLWCLGLTLLVVLCHIVIPLIYDYIVATRRNRAFEQSQKRSL